MRKVFPTLVEFLELASVKEFHYEVGSSIDNVSWERALPNIKEELEAHIRQSKMLFFQTLVKDLFKLEVPLPPSIQTQLADGVEATLLVTTEAEIDLVLSRISAGIIMSGSNFLYYADAISYGPELYHQTSVRGSEQVTQAIVAAVSSAGLDLNTATVTSIMDLGEIFECRGCWHKANLNFITAITHVATHHNGGFSPYGRCIRVKPEPTFAVGSRRSDRTSSHQKTDLESI